MTLEEKKQAAETNDTLKLQLLTIEIAIEILKVMKVKLEHGYDVVDIKRLIAMTMVSWTQEEINMFIDKAYDIYEIGKTN